MSQQHISNAKTYEQTRNKGAETRARTPRDAHLCEENTGHAGNMREPRILGLNGKNLLVARNRSGDNVTIQKRRQGTDGGHRQRVGLQDVRFILGTFRHDVLHVCGYHLVETRVAKDLKVVCKCECIEVRVKRNLGI